MLPTAVLVLPAQLAASLPRPVVLFPEGRPTTRTDLRQLKAEYQFVPRAVFRELAGSTYNLGVHYLSLCTERTRSSPSSSRQNSSKADMFAGQQINDVTHTHNAHN